MAFGDNIRKFRTERGYSQQKLAELSGLSLRSIQNYESNERYPNNIMIVKKIAYALGTTYDVLLSEEDRYAVEAAEAGGSRAARDVKELLGDINSLFAGGDVSEDDKDKVMKAIMDMYWAAKENNKKYSPKQTASK